MLFLELCNLEIKLLNFELRLAPFHTAWFLQRPGGLRPTQHETDNELSSALFVNARTT